MSTGIQYGPNNLTLFYTDATGAKVMLSFLDGSAFSDLEVILGKQMANSDNTQAVATYLQTLTDMEANFHYSPVPPKPLQKLVSNTGVVTFAPFVPTLRDLVVPNAAPSAPLSMPGSC
jgi:hypothetical protein